ncbi:hypothetical protein N7447_001758 [Penicillium robsamsonii]|uniref:uncharacterized protein n=1 Tax=Penicillium robsamsonii TaxID=1792511 RepID=UPI002547500D|nr:uncharacterized protein N7447_001758 [Penicillium robsamsonii]KAJ5835732.1 hypothetical protein N7447_001758 [Penicillium robsamsonii]
MLGSHSELSIAQIVFYIPVTVIALYLACYRHKRPRMAWIIPDFLFPRSYHCGYLGDHRTEVFQYWRDGCFSHIAQCWRVPLDHSNFRLYSNHSGSRKRDEPPNSAMFSRIPSPFLSSGSDLPLQVEL